MNRFFDILQPANMIDVLVGTCFIYGLFWWLRQSTSPRLAYRIVLAGFVLAVLFATARHFEMVLTEMVAVVTFLLIGLGTAVFFQENIQRTLDRILLLGSRHYSSDKRPPLSPVNAICEAVGELVAKSHGALIPIRGEDSWRRHIDGGVRLEGIVSVPLLLSLFDPASPGHDGAALIDGAIVTRFGVHLPLSTAQPMLGTRHAAGLGLSELCDAFIIVVSEERGSISVARRGKLNEVDSPDELRKLLEPFWMERYAALVPLPSGWKRLRKLTAPLLSLVLAVSLWLLFAYRPVEAIQSFTVPIEYVNVPRQLELVNEVPVSAEVTLSGSENALRVSKPAAMIISLDLSSIEEGTNRVPITESELRIPEGWTLYQVEPPHVDIQARPRPTAAPDSTR